MDEHSFVAQAEAEISAIDRALGEREHDRLDWQLADGVLTVEIAGGLRLVANIHRPAREIWLAARASAWHFRPEPDGSWRSARGEELRATLSRVLSDELGEHVRL